ncbi:MAG: M48 family metalloprotease [Desulfobacterales bacterium]|nr:M48 family metalloprotease [Desulfobacterales bacterium]
MIYNNLLYLLVVILLLTTNSIPQAPLLSPGEAFFFFLAKAALYFFLVRFTHRNGRVRTSRQYFAAEQKHSILGILFFAVDVYLLDCKFYFGKLPLAGQLPILVDLAGVALFFGYLAVMWLVARASYQRIFAREYRAAAFVLSNLKANLPLVLPWLIISLVFDLLQLLPFPAVKQFTASPWGEPVLLLVIFVGLALAFPALIRRVWNCTPLPAGPLRSHIEKFCREQKFACSDILLWPLFEGQAISAGVMGLSKRLRYLLITPALLQTLTLEELDAVMAHEIGHVKKYHLHLYLLLFLGFGLTVSMIANPIFYLLLSSSQFYSILSFTHSDPEAGIAFWGTLPLFVIMILYFRYVFGFFMRNFERQADLYVFTATGNSEPLIQSLEKIGWLSGNTRDLPSWHHFGIGQRVDYLQKCRKNPGLIKRHDRKVYAALILYLVVLGSAAGFLQSAPMELLKTTSQNKFVEAVLRQKIRQEPKNMIWLRLMGDLQQARGLDYEAKQAYEQALALQPLHPEVLNNLAWLLVMSDEKRVRDPRRALVLARRAVKLKATGYILDTLATSLWANGFQQEALAAEQQAIARDPANGRYYRQQMDMFAARSYDKNFFEEKPSFR